MLGTVLYFFFFNNTVQPPVASGYSLSVTGPHAVNVADTITLIPTGGSFDGVTTITLAAGPDGSFGSSTLTPAQFAMSATTTYTPSAAGPHQVYSTNNNHLVDPPLVAFVVGVLEVGRFRHAGGGDALPLREL